MTRTADDFADLSHMTDERVTALVRELAAVRLALLNATTDRDAAHAEVAELRAERSAVMAAAFTTATADVTPTALSIFP